MQERRTESEQGRTLSPVLVGCAVFVGALALRLIYLEQLAATPFLNELQLIADSTFYDMRASRIAAGGWLPDAPGFLSPLYCYFLGGIYVLFGSSLYAAKLVQALLGAASCVLLYDIGRRLFGETAGRWAAGLLVLYEAQIYYGGVLLPPTLITFLHLALVRLLVGGGGIWRFAAAGGIVGLAVMAKPNAILLVPVLAIAVLVGVGGIERGRRLAAAALLVLASTLTLTPITLINHRLTGAWILVGTTGGTNLLKGNGPTATGGHAFLPIDRPTTLLAHFAGKVDGPAAVEESRIATAQARAYMLEHPGRTLGLFGKKLLLLFNRQEIGIRDKLAFVRGQIPLLGWPLLPFWAVVPLSLAGACLAWRSWRRAGPLYAVIVVQIVSYVLIFVLARYRLTLITVLLPFAGLQLATSIRDLRNRRFKALALPLALTAAFTAVAFVPFPEFAGTRGFADQYDFMGKIYYQRGDWERSAEAYGNALKGVWQDRRLTAIRRARAAERLARCWKQLGRNAEARQLLLEVQAAVAAATPGYEVPIERRIAGLLDQL